MAPTLTKTSKARWVYLIVGAIALLLLGFMYGWSILSVPLQSNLGWSASDVAIIFSVTVAVFTIGGLLGALLTKRSSHRVTLAVAAVLLCLGYVLSSFVNSDGVFVMAITYGVVCGLSSGMAHNAILSTVNKWFPERAGTSSGLLSCAMGFGTTVIGPLAHWLIENWGWRSTFVTIGALAGTVVLLACLVVKATPDKNTAKAGQPTQTEKSDNLSPHNNRNTNISETAKPIDADFTTKQMIRLKPFWITFLWSIIVASIYLGTMGSAKQIAMEAGAASELATTMVGMIAVFDGTARFASGLFYDKLGYRKSLLTVSLLFLSSPLCLYVSSLTHNIAFMFAGFACLGVAFGSISTVLAAMTIKFYGMTNYGNNLAVVYMDFVPASMIGPPIAGFISTTTGSFEFSFVIFIIYGLIAIVLSRLVKPPQAAAATATNVQ